MRRAWGVAIAAAIVTLTAAGSSSAATWYSGARAGVTTASLRGDFGDISDPQYRVGPAVGGMFELDVAPSWAVAVEALYTQKGAKFVGQRTDETGNPIGMVDANLVLEYAEVPILLRGFVGRGNARPYVLGGPTFAFALAGRLKTEELGIEQTVSEDMKPLDLGATVGAGVRMLTQGAWRIDLEARYFRSFSDLWDISGNLESINEGFTLTLAGSR